MSTIDSLPKLGIRAIKQVTAAVHSIAAFQQNARDLVEAYETSYVSKRYKGIQINLNLALTKVNISTASCRLTGAELDTALEHLFRAALEDTEQRRAQIAKGAIDSTLEDFNEPTPEPLAD